jgi:hypothetical protein
LRDRFERGAGDVAGIDLLGALAREGREGGGRRLLRFDGGPGLVSYLLDGFDLVSVSAGPRVSPLETLVRSGKVQRETFDALAVPEGADRFRVAVDCGVVSRREAAWACKLAAIESLAEVLAASSGQYRLDPAGDGPEEFRLPIRRWILELLLRSQDRGLVLAALGPVDVVLIRNERFDEEFAALELTADADGIIARLDGSTTAEEIVRSSRSDEFAVLKLLAALRTLGIVRAALEEGPAPAPAEEPAVAADIPPPIEEPAALPPHVGPVSLFALSAPETPAEREEIEAILGSTQVADEASPGRRVGIWIAVAVAAVGIGAVGAWLRHADRAVRRPKASSVPRPISPAALPKVDAPTRNLEPGPVSSVTIPPRSSELAARPAAPAPQDSPSLATWAAAGEKRFRHPGAETYALQLELACETSTIDKAISQDPGRRNLWIVPFIHRGRGCYRVLWGRYRTLALAKNARRGLPAFFRTGEEPVVVRLGR